MKDEHKISSEIEDLNSFQVLTTSYTEIAAIRMKKTRESVLRNRQFLSNLDDIFTDVRVSYAREVLSLGRASDDENKRVTFLSHNGKSVGVFLSANTGLYGDIIDRTFKLFKKEVEESDLEVTIVGKLGLQFFQSAMPDRPYTYFDLDDKSTKPDELANVIKHLVQYEEIKVYYPTFQSAVNQRPSRYTISADTPLSELQRQASEKTHYLFEPSLKEVLVFFEKEIFASLLDQTIRESQLAKYAARIMALDKAGENIKEELKKMNLIKLRLEHKHKNKKQLETLMGHFK